MPASRAQEQVNIVVFEGSPYRMFGNGDFNLSLSIEIDIYIYIHLLLGKLKTCAMYVILYVDTFYQIVSFAGNVKSSLRMRLPTKKR